MKLSVIAGFCILSVLFLSCSNSGEPSDKVIDDTPGVESNTEFGIPTDADSVDDIIIERSQYTLSYNPGLGLANWVCWNVDAESYGDAKKASAYFRLDTLLPDSLRTVSNDDYTNSGYDRGQMVPWQERSSNIDDLEATYFITNAMPQLPDLNRGPWAAMEDLTEKKCIEDSCECYCIAGPVFADTDTTFIAGGKIAVPVTFFKIVLVTKKGLGLEDVSESNCQVYAVVIPNSEGIKDNHPSQYSVRVEVLEEITGYDFFSKLPDDLEEKLENPDMIMDWSICGMDE